MILKIQRPLDNPSGPWLLYSEGRKNQRLVPDAMVPSFIRKAAKATGKAYFKGGFAGTQLVIENVVEARDW